MSPMRKAALIAGLAYIATFVFSIPVKFGFWVDVLDKPDFILGAGNAGGVPLGALFEVLTALGGVVTAVALYTIAKRYSAPGRAGLRDDTSPRGRHDLRRRPQHPLRLHAPPGRGRHRPAPTPAPSSRPATPSSPCTTGRSCSGPASWPALNALLIGSVMYRSRLLPRWIPTLGLIGAPLLLVSDTATLFGVWDQISGPAALLALPIAIWEFSFGVYMTVKGFKPSAVIDESSAPVSSASFADVAV